MVIHSSKGVLSQQTAMMYVRVVPRQIDSDRSSPIMPKKKEEKVKAHFDRVLSSSSSSFGRFPIPYNASARSTFAPSLAFPTFLFA